VTTFYVLRGSITAQQLDPATGQPRGAPLQVGTMQAYSQAGGATPQLAPVPPEKVSEVTSGLQPSGPRGGGNVANEQLKAQALGTAAGLLAALTGTGIDTSTVTTLLNTAATEGVAELRQSVLLIPEVATAIEENAAVLEQFLSGGTDLIGNITLQNTPAKRFSGSFKSTSTDALVTVTDAVVAQSGADFIDAIADATVELAGPLARFVNSALVTSGSLFSMTGGRLSSTSSAALVDLDPTVIAAAGALVAMNGGVLSIAGPLLTDVGGVLTTGAPLVTMTNGALLESTGSDALVELVGTSVHTAGALSMTSSTMHLAGPLAHVLGVAGGESDGVLPTLFFLDASTLTSTGSGPLITFASTDGDPDGSFLRMVNGSRMTLAGPLFAGSGSTSAFGSGSPTSAAAFIALLDGSKLTSTSPAPLIQLSDTTFEGNGPVLTLRRSASVSDPTSISLAGPLFSAAGTTLNTTTRAFGPTFGTANNCCSVFGVEQGSALSSTTSLPLINLTASTVTVSDGDSGGAFVLLTDTVGGFPPGELVAPSTISLAGPLLAASGSGISPLFSLLNVNRSSFSSTSADALVSLTGSTVQAGGTDIFGTPQPGRLLTVISTNSPFGTAASPASVTLAGPLLAATSSSFDGAQLVGVFGGASFTSTTTAPLVSLSNSLMKLTTVTSGPVVSRGDMVSIGGVGGPDAATFATMVLHGPLLSVSGGSVLNLSSGLVGVFNGGALIESHPSDPFVAIAGGAHVISSEAGTGMLRLFGRATATTSEVIATPGLNTSTSTLTLGTDQPLQRSGSGAYAEVSNASVSAQSGLIVDHALLNASAPLLSLNSGATLTSAANTLNLTSQAKLVATGPLVKLDASTLNIVGHAVRALGGSFLSIGGDLFSLANASQLNITNGGALLVSGGSVVKIAGGLVSFSGGGNQLNVTNGFTPTLGCSTQCGPFANSITLQNGASFGNVSISGNAIKNASAGSVNVTGAAIILDGANSKLIISGN
jgi:hypothetical protein